MRFSRPSPAMAVALLALFVALGGSGYAALRVPRHSVGTKQLKKNAVTSSKVEPGSLRTSDFKASQLAGLRGPRGAEGPQGPQGPAGANGATNVVMRQGADATIAGNGFGMAVASCQAGERATGGGVYNETNVNSLYVTSSYPLPNPTSPPATGNGQVPTGWRVWMHNALPTPLTVNAYVLCAAP